MRLQLLGLGVLGFLTACQTSAQPPQVPPGQPTPVAGQLCPAWVHDSYQTKGPDGENYATWHPQVDPNYKCFFDHEHGDDPTTSLANNTLPPFGYVGKLAAMDEPHPGFKVFVANKGSKNDEDRTALTSTRIVAHMGTGGVKRFSEQHHSLMFDLVAPDGHKVSVQGMASTGLAGSICDRDISLGDANPANDVGRTVGVLKGLGCDGFYEIWTFTLRLADKVEVIASTAAFDPVTVMDPADRSKLVYTKDAYSLTYDLHGCNREAYHGPVYWYNKSGPEVFYTDAFGKAGGAIKQMVSLHDDIGIQMSQRPDGFQNQFKLHKPTCANGLGLKN